MFKTRKIEVNEFTCEYAGELVSEKEGLERQDLYFIFLTSK